jgi:hypothetical protein
MEKINYENLPAWLNKRLEPYLVSEVMVGQYCARTGDDFGLMDACVYLSNLSTDQIMAVGKAKIPPSCWYTMVMLNDDGPGQFDAGIKIALQHQREKGTSDVPLVVKLRGALSVRKKVGFKPEDLRAATEIAEKYYALSAKESRVFAQMAAYLRKNGRLSPKQIGFIGSLLNQMRAKRVQGKTKAETDVLQRLYSMID